MWANVLDAFQNLGSMGLFLSMFLEGSSVPFPGIIVVMAFGYLLHPEIPEIFWLSLSMALVYCLASYIPYAIGRRLEINAAGKLGKRLAKAQYLFRKYGEFSICVTRPFMLGNYISYVAGMSRVKPWRYGLLTFSGIFPWAFAVLLLGKLYYGSSLREYIYCLKTPLIIFLFILFGTAAFFVFKKFAPK